MLLGSVGISLLSLVCSVGAGGCKGLEQSGIGLSGLRCCAVYVKVLAVGYVCVMGIDVVISVGLVVKKVQQGGQIGVTQSGILLGFQQFACYSGWAGSRRCGSVCNV